MIDRWHVIKCLTLLIYSIYTWLPVSLVAMLLIMFDVPFGRIRRLAGDERFLNRWLLMSIGFVEY